MPVLLVAFCFQFCGTSFPLTFIVLRMIFKSVILFSSFRTSFEKKSVHNHKNFRRHLITRVSCLIRLLFTTASAVSVRSPPYAYTSSVSAYRHDAIAMVYICPSSPCAHLLNFFTHFKISRVTSSLNMLWVTDVFASFASSTSLSPTLLLQQ